MGIRQPLCGFMLAFNFQDIFLGQVRDFLGLGDSQGFALGKAPVLQAFSNFGFISLVGGRIEICAQKRLGEVLLGQVVIG